MAQKKYFMALIVLFAASAMPSKAQDLKGGICPANANASNRYSNFVSKNDLGWTDDYNNSQIRQSNFSAPQYFPAMLNATSFGAGAVGTFPISNNYILRTSLTALSSTGSYGLLQQNSRGILLPIEFGLRIPIVHSILGTMDYTLYGETTAGLLLGIAYPTGGSFLSYSIPNSRFSTGAAAYLGLGNTLRFDRYLGLYLNGGAGYFDLFSSTFVRRTNFFYPSISIGFYFNLSQ